MFLFTDGSVAPKPGIGFGAYVAFERMPEALDDLKNSIQIRRFENTTSTQLELQTWLWALSEITAKEVISFTDSQNIVGLLSRKERLIRKNYTAKSGKPLANHALYREFFESIETKNIQFRSIRGHKPTTIKDRMDEVFALVDRASRQALRAYLRANPQGEEEHGRSSIITPQPSQFRGAPLYRPEPKGDPTDRR